ncbi:SDR family NAD(P)-dependent oxidoreductase [Metallumcola ferriviriculae]|uniref:SDR family NAD(P)-dependent oxidoreductase n=1 Tax=Metallumcola ferriviriculae TaxID=3039180 RepID=A0AAU0UL12_9FIRM|nr:SDR family NAD(P)-dependent oxidoreductase [Desulfitibacteraceae bacterium MK1]
MKKAIIIGASSGMGKELAKILSEDNFAVGLMARREDLLSDLQKQLSTTAYIKKADVAKPEEAMALLEELINEMDGTDIIVISAGVGHGNRNLEWAKEKETIDINVSGFTAMADAAFKYFADKGEGHIVGISSIAAIRGNAAGPAYNASKAFVSNYLEGLRMKAKKSKLPITVTDVQPGFVQTDMLKGKGLFWVSTPEKAAQQIYAAVKARKNKAYITKRWRLIAWALKLGIK